MQEQKMGLKQSFTSFFSNPLSKEKKIYLITNIIFSLLTFTGLTYFLISSVVSRSTNPAIEAGEVTFLALAFAVLLIVFIGLLVLINLWIYIPTESKLEYKQQLLLSIITLQIPAIVYSSSHLKLYDFRFVIKKWRVIDVAIIGLLLGIFSLFDFLGNLIPPIMPFYLTISIKFIPLFFCAYLTTFSKTFVLCALAAPVTFFMSKGSAVNAWSLLLDYVLPIMVVSLACFVKPPKTENKIIRISTWAIFITLPMILNLLSKSLSGVLFYGDALWDGFNIWAYSISLNLVNVMTDYILLWLTVPVICESLHFLKVKYQ